MGERLVEHDELGDTVEHAAHVLGCKPEQIAKTMSLQLSTGPIVVAMAGDAKVNSSKFKAAFHEKAVMVPWDQVEEVIGHEPGAVTPFALNEGVKENYFLLLFLPRLLGWPFSKEDFFRILIRLTNSSA